MTARRGRTRASLGCGVAAAVMLGGAAAHAGDPDRQWMTIESAHFVIHYPVELGAIARRLGVVAERAHATLVPAMRHRPVGKTMVILHDDTDSANGFASVVPRNAVTIFATAPHGASVLGDGDDWLYTLFAHEYTHILHLDTMEGLPALYNGLWGKLWAPNQLQPRWVIEGLATYQESKRSSGGRTRNAEAEATLRTQVLAGRPMRLDQMTGSPRLFPGGNVAYLHGSSFLRYVFDRLGDDRAAAMSHAGGAYPVPFAINRQIEEAVGQSFPALYDGWVRHLRDRFALQSLAVARREPARPRPLTRSGVTNWSPRFSRDGQWLWWLASDGKRLAAVRRMPVGKDASASEEVTRIDALGKLDLASDGSLVYEQTRSYRDVYSVQDLFVRPGGGGPAWQLTRQRRARDPAVSPDGRKVAYSQNLSSRSGIAVSALVPAGERALWREADARGLPRADERDLVWLGAPFEQAYEPAWSPDGAALAFSVLRRGGRRDILLLALASGRVTSITDDRAYDRDPTFSPDGRWLLFCSDRTGISNVYAYELGTGELWQVTDELGGATQPVVSPQGQRLVFRALGADGYDLFELPFSPETWRRAAPYLDDRPPPVTIRDDEAKLSAPRPYRALETLAPQTWGLETSSTPNGSYATVRVSGVDAARLHTYSLATGLAWPRGELNVAGSYGYSGLSVPIRLSGSRTASERTGFRVGGKSLPYRDEVWSGAISMGLPGQRHTDSQWFLSFDFAADYSRLLEKPDDTPDPNLPLPRRPLTDSLQTGLGVRASFADLENTIHGVGHQAGLDVTVGLRVDLPELGATYRALTASYAARWFAQLPLGRYPPTVALRLAGAARVGDLVRSGTYGLGGVPTQDLVSAALDSTRASTVGSLRGYAPRAVAGNQFHLFAAEVRQVVWNVERGFSTLPIYLERVHVAALSDTAAAWDGEPTASALRTSVGGALRLDVTLGYFAGGTLELGLARGLGERGITDVWFLLTGVL